MRQLYPIKGSRKAVFDRTDSILYACFDANDRQIDYSNCIVIYQVRHEITGRIYTAASEDAYGIFRTWRNRLQNVFTSKASSVALRATFTRRSDFTFKILAAVEIDPRRSYEQLLWAREDAAQIAALIQSQDRSLCLNVSKSKDDRLYWMYRAPRDEWQLRFGKTHTLEKRVRKRKLVPGKHRVPVAPDQGVPVNDILREMLDRAHPERVAKRAAEQAAKPDPDKLPEIDMTGFQPGEYYRNLPNTQWWETPGKYLPPVPTEADEAATPVPDGLGDDIDDDPAEKSYDDYLDQQAEEKEDHEQ